MTLNWTRHNDGVYTLTPDSIDANDGYGIAVYQAGAFNEWYFNVWNERNPDGMIHDSFDVAGGSSASADDAMATAERWLKMYLSYMSDVY